MKRKLLALFLTISMITFGQTNAIKNPPINFDSLLHARAKEAIGKPFPSFHALANKTILTNKDLKGKVVFVNFWFEACAPCIAEFDALNELYLKLKDNNKFEFLSFTYETPKKLQEIKGKYNIQYKVASIEKQDCYRLNQNNGFPTSIIFDSNGTIKYLKTGGSSDKVKARQIIFDEVIPNILKEL